MSTPAADYKIDHEERGLYIHEALQNFSLNRMAGTGRRLYQAAEEKLGKIIPAYRVATNLDVSILDLIIFIIRHIRPILAIMFDANEGERPQRLLENRYVQQVATRLLKKAGMVYGNEDALFLLAEMNFVSASFECCCCAIVVKHLFFFPSSIVSISILEITKPHSCTTDSWLSWAIPQRSK